MKVLKFIWLLIKNLVIYTLSVIPASCQEAWHGSFSKNNWQSRDNNRPVRFEEGQHGQHKHRRRGHRGGKKHRRHF